MAVKVGELYALLRLDKKQWDKALKDAENGLDKFSKRADQLVKVGQNLTKWVTAPVVGIGAAAVKMASDVEQAAGKFDVSFREMAAVSRETLTQLAADMQRSRFQMQAYAADAQAILAPMVQNRDLAAQMSVALSALTVDLASYMNIADRDAHQRLISGLLGSTQATEILGISLRATTLQAEAERLGIQANIATLDDATQIRLRFIAILRQSIDAQTDAIRSSASFESQLRALQADMHELSVTLGQELLPYALAAVRWARDLTDSLKQLSPESKQALIQFGLMAATAGPLAIGLGKVARGVTVTGRALIALTRLAKADPLILLAVAAAGLALSIEEVRDAVDELFKSLGLGAPFEAVERLTDAFAELDALVSGLEFDPVGAQEEAAQRLRSIYEQTLRDLEGSLRDGGAGIGGALGEGVTDGIRRVLESEQRGLPELIKDTLRQTEGFGFDHLLQNIEAVFPLVQRLGNALVSVPVEFDREMARALLEQQLALSGISDTREADIARVQLERDLLQDELIILRRQAAALEDLREQYRQAGESVGEVDEALARVNAAIIKNILDSDRLASELAKLRTVDTSLEDLVREFDLLELRADAGLISIEDTLAGLHELRATLIQLAVEGAGSLAEASAEQLQLYVRLSDAIERWMESMETAPSRLDKIRAEMDRALGVGMAVERELARATGADFDPIAYEMDVLTRAIREMYDATGAITPEMEGLLRDLAALAREHEALATTEGLVRSALDGFGRNLGDLGRLLSRSVTFQAGQGFGFDATSFFGGAIGFGIDLLFSAIGGLDDSSQALERAAEALETASESWRRTLSEGQFHELLTATPAAQIEELRKARADAQHEIAMLERRWIQIWNAASRGARIRELQDVIDEIDRTIKELESSAATDVVARIEELLGITTRGLQGAISGAFSAATAEDFAKSLENSLTGRIRNAWVTAFLESATMAPLFESLGDSIREALLDVDISPDEMEGIRAIIDEIKQRSQPFYELLDEMGLLADATERVNREFGTLRNIPSGFKIVLERFRAATPAVVPTFHGGGVMPYDGLANLRRGEVILTPEQARGMGGPVIHISIQGPVYGIDDLDRRITTSVRRAMQHGRMSQFGVT